MKFLRSVTGYTRKDQIRNNEIREGLNIFNLNARSIKSRSQWKYHVQRMEDRRIPRKFLQPEKETKGRTPTVKMQGSGYFSRGRNRPRIAGLPAEFEPMTPEGE
jgi:hypothetical protein